MSDEEDEFIKANTPTRKPSQPSALSFVIPTKKGRTLESYFNAHNPADSEHTESEKVRKSQAPPNLLSTSSKPWTAALRVPTKAGSRHSDRQNTELKQSTIDTTNFSLKVAHVPTPNSFKFILPSHKRTRDVSAQPTTASVSEAPSYVSEDIVDDFSDEEKVDHYNFDVEFVPCATPPPKKRKKLHEHQASVDGEQSAAEVASEVIDSTEDTEETDDESSNKPLLLSEPNKVPIVEVPARINARLHEYQREGVRFLYSMFVEKKGALLCDDMGLGKTVQTIAFVCAIKKGAPATPSNFFSPTMSSNNNSDPQRKPLAEAPVLVVCPASVMHHWHNEYCNWTKLRVFICHGRGKEAILEKAEKGKADVVLASYETLKSSFNRINSIVWSCIVFDEAHKIRNKSSKLSQMCKRLRVIRRYGLTGTVMQNSLEELWNLVDFICPRLFGDLDYFKRQFIVPILAGHLHDASASTVAQGRVAAKALADKLRKIMLRRTKAQVAHQLPPKEEHVVLCQMTKLQMRIYKRALASRHYERLRRNATLCACNSGKLAAKCCHKDDQMDVEHWKALVLPAIVRLQKLASHVELIMVDKDPNSIDMDQVVGNSAVAAVEKLKRDAAFCKMVLGEDAPLITSLISEGNDLELSGKLKFVKAMLPRWHAEGSKVLLFSSSTKTLDILERFLKREGYSHLRIDGGTPMHSRQKIVDSFNKTKSLFVLLVSTKACGLGLNLAAASVVVIFEPNWNVTHDMQASDRVHRFGQKRVAQIYRLVSAGTIEELTYRRQIYKQQLANIAEGGLQRRMFRHNELFGSHLLFSFIEDQIPSIEIVETVNTPELSYKIVRANLGVKQSDASNQASEDAVLQLILDHARVKAGEQELTDFAPQLAEKILDSKLDEEDDDGVEEFPTASD